MRITADTNVLVRAAVVDDPIQAAIAKRVLREADLIVVTLPCLCEFVWVLTRGYKRNVSDLAASLRELTHVEKVVVDRAAVEAGLAVLEEGGDFADGVIAFEGRRGGGPVFASFDKEAVAIVARTGGQTRLLG